MSDIKASKKREKRKPAVELPRLMTHRQVAEVFQVTPAGLRKWVARGEFPCPHSIIVQTWYYREDIVAHRIKTGQWPEGLRFIRP